MKNAGAARAVKSTLIGSVKNGQYHPGVNDVMDLEMNEPNVISTPDNISVTFIDGGFPRCTASANIHFQPEHESCWWVSRVLVSRDEDRGKGYGGRALDILLLEIEKQGGKAVIVTPGGYGADPKKQIRFYEAHGFVKVGDTEYNQYWMWTATAP